MPIRRQPEDFRVEEELTAEFRSAVSAVGGPGAWAVYRVRKRSMTTPQAAAGLAAGLGLRAAEVEYAGLKDRHAETVQHMTAAVGPRGAADRLKGHGWSAELLGWSPRAMAADAIGGNRFEIVVRGLSRAEVSAAWDRASAVRGPRGILMLNYFGDQRFGSARHGCGFAARRLIDGDFDGALRLLVGTPARKDSGPRRTLTRVAAGAWGDWTRVVRELDAAGVRTPERAPFDALAAGRDSAAALATLPRPLRMLAIESYQSWLWNAAVRTLAERAGGERCLRAEDEFGELRFVPADLMPGSWVGVSMPMPAAGVAGAEPWAGAMASALECEGLTMDRVTLPVESGMRFGRADRPLVVEVRDVSAEGPRRDETAPAKSSKPLRLTLCFGLPRGAYATVFLRVLGL